MNIYIEMGSFTKETQSLRLISIYNDYICFNLFYYYVKLSLGELFQSLIWSHKCIFLWQHGEWADCNDCSCIAIWYPSSRKEIACPTATTVRRILAVWLKVNGVQVEASIMHESMYHVTIMKHISCKFVTPQFINHY